MMTHPKFGDVKVQDYLRMAGRPRAWRRTRAVGTAGAIIFAFAAGGFAPWAGKNSKNMSLRDALAIVDRQPAAEWEHEQAVGVAQNHLWNTLTKLREVAARSSPGAGHASEYAAAALAHSAITAIEGLEDLAASGRDAKAADRLDRIRTALKRKD